jgi:hypothetical protein
MLCYFFFFSIRYPYPDIPHAHWPAPVPSLPPLRTAYILPNFFCLVALLLFVVPPGRPCLTSFMCSRTFVLMARTAYQLDAAVRLPCLPSNRSGIRASSYLYGVMVKADSKLSLHSLRIRSWVLGAFQNLVVTSLLCLPGPLL